MFSVVTGGGAEQQPWRGQGAAPQQQYQPNQTGQNWLATARVGPRASTVKKLSMYRHNYTMVVKDTHKKKLKNNVNSRTIPNSKNDLFSIHIPTSHVIFHFIHFLVDIQPWWLRG